MTTIEYDETKKQINLRKHHISIPELATICNNPFIAPITDIPDELHSNREQRFHAYGWTSEYKYYDMDQVIAAALNKARELLA